MPHSPVRAHLIVEPARMDATANLSNIAKVQVMKIDHDFAGKNLLLPLKYHQRSLGWVLNSILDTTLLTLLQWR